MKTYLLSLLLISLLCFISCDFGLTGDEDEDLTELEKLPPLTTTGENTFGCLVNGEVFLVENTSKLSAIYQGGFVQLGAEFNDSDLTKSIRIILDDPLAEQKKYLLGESDTYRTRFRTRSDSPICYYEYNDTFDGYVTISNINRTAFILSGTFEFSTVTDRCDTVNITEGRFDVQYIP